MKKHQHGTIFRIFSIFALFCLLAVQGFAQYTYPPAMMGISPYNGTGATQSFYITAYDFYGYANTQLIYLRFGNWAGGCVVAWIPNSNQVGLLNDAGTAWTYATLGGSGTLENSKCQINVSSTSKSVGGNYTTGYVTATFKPAFAGPQAMYGYVSSFNNLNSGWIPANPSAPPGTWTVPGPQPPTNISIAPTAANETTRTFSIQFTDPAGTGNVDYIQPVLGGWGGCRPLFYPVWNAVYLMTDAGTWGNAVTIGGSTNLENSKCRLNVNATSLNFINSTTMAVNFSVTAKVWPGTMGDGTTGVFINGLNGLNSGLVTLGTWTIPPPPDTNMSTTRESPHAPDPGDPSVKIPVSISQSNQTAALRVYNVNDPVTFRIRFAKPNKQVWVQRHSMRFTDGAFIADPLCTPVVGIGGHEEDGACLLGITDSSGFFEWNGQILNSLIGTTTVKFWVGDQVPDPAQPTTTWGPMNDDNYVGALVYHVIGTSGFPQPPVW